MASPHTSPTVSACLHDGWEAEFNLVRFLWRYFHVRPHSSIGVKTPQEVHAETDPVLLA